VTRNFSQECRDRMLPSADIELFNSALEAHSRTFATVADLEQVFLNAVRICRTGLAAGHCIMLCGNGGSAADAQHVAAELTGRFHHDRRALAAIALTADASAITAIGNDYGFDQVFARQICALGRAGDVLIAISTSGSSPNVLAASATASALGMRTIALTGGGGGRLAELCEVALVVPTTEIERVQEAHMFLLHCLCAAVERGIVYDCE